MAKTLEITGNEQEAWKILEELAGLYGDNGGDPDGNAWFPSMVITKEEAEDVISAGLGKMTSVLYCDDDDELAAALKIQDVLALAQECDDWEALKNAVNDRVKSWAHYGAYGAGDSVWVIERQ